MYLKSLEMRGFKSFADNTELQLQPGINIIVGPNGCGKSNVVDAVRWVLGEANIRHLRGQRNEDVIFNGSDKKKGLGMALVEMVVDNSDHSLPVEYEELCLSRKIYRSGESEYYINKSRVRLKDIVKLFTGTGLGQKGYSIISQGELEQVLNGQPFERRLMLEEASGIIKYRQQRDEVRARLQSSSQDLLRLQDILSELETRQADLHLKAEKARRYLDMNNEATDMEKQLLAWEIRENHKNLAARREEIEKHKNELARMTEALEEINSAWQLQNKILEEQRVLQADLKEQKHSCETALKSMESEIGLCQERIINYQERIKAAAHDSRKYNHMLAGLDQDLQIKTADLDSEKEKFAARLKELTELQRQIQEQEKDIGEKSRLLEEQREIIFAKAQQEAGVRNEINEKEDQKRKTWDKKERLAIHLEENHAKIKGWREKALGLQQDLSHKRHKLRETEQAVLLTQKQLQELTTDRSSLEEEINRLDQEIMGLENRLLAIRDLELDFTGYSEGVKAVMKSVKRGEKSLQDVQGIVADIIDVPAGLETALETAAGRGLESIVVGSAEQARLAIDFVKKKQAGRVTFLPLDILRIQKVPDRVLQEAKKIKGVLGLASELVHYDHKYVRAVEYLLGRVLVVDNLPHGLEVFKNSQYPWRIVTLEGDLINASGAMTGGTAPSGRVSPLQRKAEEKKSRQRLEKLKQSREQKRTQLKRLLNDIQAAEGMLGEIKNQSAELEFQIKITSQEADALDISINETDKQNETYRLEIKHWEDTMAELDLSIANLRENLASFHRENTNFADDMEKIKETLEHYQREYDVRKERLLSYNDQLSMKKKELENMEKTIAQFLEVKKSYQESAQEAEELQRRLQTEIEEQNRRIKNIQQKIVDKHQELDRILESMDTAQKFYREHAGQAEQLQAQITPRQQSINMREESVRALEMKAVRTETELDSQHSRWQERFYNEDPWTFEHSFTPGQIRENRRRIDFLREELDLLGPVDVEAIQEYAEVQQRFDFLNQQNLDLIAARDSLQLLLRETEKIMARDFDTFFVQANESFGKTFQEIFSGGEARLEMLETDDRLSAGVDIVVKMPGKKSQSLNLLSGGERALTCIAFIFSLLRLKPAPFCLLDEIDASLDETNLLRFTRFLKDMAHDTQFIVITHRQAIIEAGEIIYGVTMPQEGISAIFSLNVGEAETMAG